MNTKALSPLEERIRDYALDAAGFITTLERAGTRVIAACKQLGTSFLGYGPPTRQSRSYNGWQLYPLVQQA